MGNAHKETGKSRKKAYAVSAGVSIRTGHFRPRSGNSGNYGYSAGGAAVVSWPPFASDKRWPIRSRLVAR